MMRKIILHKSFIISIFVCLMAHAAFAQTTEFTYQGKLTDTGAPSATYDFEFRLWNAEAGGAAPLATLQRLAVPVSNGVFTVRLDFGSTHFNGDDRWLEIGVRRPGELMFVNLAPRQKFSSVPYTIRSLDATRLGGIDANAYLQTNGDGSSLINLNADNVSSGTLMDARLSPNVARLDANQTFAGANTFNGLTLAGDSELIAPRLENAAADPMPASAANAGRVYFNTTTGSVTVSNGASWQSLSPPARQVLTGPTTFEQLNCNAGVLRSVSFTKNSASTRLRISYTDTPSAVSGGAFSIRLNGRIDGTIITNPARFGIYAEGYSSAAGGYAFGQTTTIVGYVNGVPAGMHTLSFTYEILSFVGTVSCYTGGNMPSYLVEIEEVP